MEWGSVSRILCDRRISIKLKWKIFKITIRLPIFYSTVCWIVKKQYVHKMNVIRTKMIKWISGRE